MKKINIADIILIIMFLFAIGLVIWYFVGDSPTFEQIMIGFVLPIVFGIAIKTAVVGTKINYVERDVKALKNDVKNSFEKIKEDMDLIKGKLKIR